MLCPETNSFQLSKLSAASSPATSSTKLPSPSPRGVKRHLLDLGGGDVAGNGLSKLFLTIAATFAEAERDRISQAKADQKARGRFLGGEAPFGFEVGADGALVPIEAQQEAIREITALRAQGRSLRAIRDEMRAKGHQISHQGVARVLRAVEC
jgi:putative DNA-invertase from lambdoid prophage Rac